MRLWRAVSSVLLLRAVLFHEKAQHFARRRFGDAEVLVLVRFDSIGEVIEHIGQRMDFIVAHFIEQRINRGAGLSMVRFTANRGHTHELLERYPSPKNGLRIGLL